MSTSQTALLEPEWFTAKEVGARLKLKPTTIRTWAKRGVIPSHRLAPKVVRYELTEVLTALGLTPQVTGS